MREKEKIMLVGIGELGGILLEFLCRVPQIGDIVTADANEDWGRRKTNSAILGASYLGLYPRITFEPLDLVDVDRTAEMLHRLNPTIIYNGTTLQSWWVVNELPPEANARLYRDRAGLGVWTAMHLALSYRLMQAVELAGISTYVVNSSFPDVTNASLGRVGLAPTVGIGNMDLIIPYIRKAAAEILQVPMSTVQVMMIGHHYHAYNWCRTGRGYEAPHFLRVYVGPKDVTPELGDLRAFVAELPRRGMRPPGRHGQYLVAASSLKNILAIYNDTGELTHAPGPQGLEGGYPVRLSRRGAEVVLPEGMSLEEARGLMLAAQKFDGVEEIAADGAVVLTPEAREVLREEFDLDWKRITLKDSLEQARELRARFEEFGRRHGVAIPR